MKPVRLVMQNFGPYREQMIDFEQFAEAPLFLISGKTGSGKTTIFDGMCYALYGETTGGVRAAQDMRSNFADPTAPTRVEFVFEHQGTYYEVTREPKQILAKKKGEGTTEKPAKVTFSQLSQAGEPLNQLTKANEVNQAIDELLHLTASQFTQIILLPQGEFRRFLNASSDEKERVLRRLFSTNFYNQVAEKLKQTKKNETKRLAEDEQKIDWLFGQINFDEAFQARFDETEVVNERLALVDQQNQLFQQQADNLSVQVSVLESERKKIEQSLNQAEQLVAMFEQQGDLQASLTRLAEEEPEILGLQQQVQYWEWLEKHQASLRQLTKEEQFVVQSQTAKQMAEEDVATLAVDLKTAQVRLEELTSQADEMAKRQRQADELARLLPKIDELATLQTTVKQAEQELLTIEQTAQDLSEQQQTITTKIEEHQAQLAQETDLVKELASVQASLTALTQQVQMWQQLADDYQQYQVLQADITKQADKLASDAQQANEAKAFYQQKKSHAASLQIARLSLDLMPGEACPVCGSLDHPNPHQATEWSVEAITAAELAVEQAEATYLAQEKQLASGTELAQQLASQAEIKQAELITKWQTLQPDGQIERTLAELSQVTAQALADLSEQQIASQTQAEQLEQTLAGLAQVKMMQTKLQDELATVAEQQDEIISRQQPLSQQVTTLQGQMVQLAKEVPSDWQTVDYQARQAQLQAEYEAWQQAEQAAKQAQQTLKEQHLLAEEKLVHQTEQLLKATQRLAELSQELETALVASPFDKTIAEMRADEPLIAQLASTQALINQHEQTKQKQEVLLEQVTRQLADQTYPDMSLIKAQQQANQEALALKQNLVSVAQQAIQHNQTIYRQIAAQHQQLQTEWEQLAELTMLADVANGDGKYKLSFERYVLQIYFLETLKIANQKLQKLTNNRYSFELEDKFGTYGKNTGLELNVYDDNVGATRSVNTLSGGESFVAALSLSLALGEVMQAQAGGIRVDALFIDEGFGSLDEESLEMAIEALELVESKGRMIGIISHVKELKERIPQQLQVEAGAAGESRVHYQIQEG
ncbi:AAA family ATPase [Vagococcus zengguangii]|uniref:Nuclease SbcCD subunit C n=1 Tax=Vagococcus zengguangii TaxID=2571750 RepID=A0A4D7CZQ0_9ENTE|nr:SMC family ATPase [Vagococcus zengguangii]QCI87210.1 SMC family ATPase [Vagococcus zengguangii]TLG80714.1 SMC family ATPase [Vagococcus zengguangii]